MDFAVYMGDEKTVIYKRGQGIVLNEPTLAAVKEGGKVVGLGKAAERYIGQDGIIIETPIINGCIDDAALAGAFFSNLWQRVSGQNIAIRRRCVFCIPSSISSDQLNEYKTAVYSAGVADAEFIPAVIASAVGLGYDVYSQDTVISVVIENQIADIAAIKLGEIIAGGTITELDKLDAAIAQVAQSAGFAVEQAYHGDRISIAKGAGKLLDNERLVKRIVSVN